MDVAFLAKKKVRALRWYHPGWAMMVRCVNGTGVGRGAGKDPSNPSIATGKGDVVVGGPLSPQAAHLFAELEEHVPPPLPARACAPQNTHAHSATAAPQIYNLVQKKVLRHPKYVLVVDWAWLQTHRILARDGPGHRCASSRTF